MQSLPMRIAVALAESANRALGAARCRLKWPNDLVVGRRKLGGLLVDALVASRRRRLGDRRLRPEPRSRRGGAAGGGGDLAPRGAGGFAAASAGGVHRRLRGGGLGTSSRGAETGLARALPRLSVHRPGDVVACDLAGERVDGRFVAFDALGFLVLETEFGPRTVRSGEVFAW